MAGGWREIRRAEKDCGGWAAGGREDAKLTRGLQEPMGFQGFVTQFSGSIVWQGWSRGKAQSGTLDVCRRSWVCGVCSDKTELWALRSVGTRDAPAPALRLWDVTEPRHLHSSVNDILSLERGISAWMFCNSREHRGARKTFSTCDGSQNSEGPRSPVHPERRQRRQKAGRVGALSGIPVS